MSDNFDIEKAAKDLTDALTALVHVFVALLEPLAEVFRPIFDLIKMKFAECTKAISELELAMETMNPLDKLRAGFRRRKLYRYVNLLALGEIKSPHFLKALSYEYSVEDE